MRADTNKIPTWTPDTLKLFQQSYASRNRYINKLPCTLVSMEFFLQFLDERSRVKLGVERNPEHCDYINASFLHAAEDPSMFYIATQAPIPRTISDFWQMVAEQNVRVIVMLVTADGMKVRICYIIVLSYCRSAKDTGPRRKGSSSSKLESDYATPQ